VRARSAKALIYFLIRLLITDRSITFAGFINLTQFITARSELRKVLFLALSVTFLFVHEISRFAPNSQGRRAWMSLNVKVKGQGHQGQKRHFSALSAACVWFMFGKSQIPLR